ncbi:MAG: A/G-specific adenine glycosylase [Epsilonproteobacteria bacterium]|nr:A/G-specific adenine glycosylase [Campylobacterota bacterium]
MEHKKLRDWYAKYGRKDLPWRNTNDPYQIYLSEVMLQQTQVKTVLERFYFPFLERFPTLEALANADLDEVLKLWEGLGYYTRAKNLHKAAKLCAPKLPENYDELLKLPGIGKNTASAICAFAYKQERAVMEANVKRILCRIYALKSPQEEVLRRLALEMLDRKNPFDHNQAMMDIGSMICKVRNPDCQMCPFQAICKADEEGLYDYPEKKRKRVPTRSANVVVRHKHEKFFLKRRDGRFLHGLWGFEVVASLPEGVSKIGEVVQQYTHFKFEATVYCVEADDLYDEYLSYDEIGTIALSGVDKKILALLKKDKLV